MLSRRVVVLVATVLCGLTVATPVASAGTSRQDEGSGKDLGALAQAAREAGISQEVLDLMAKQSAIDDLADRIDMAAQDTATSGLGGLRVDAEHNTLHVYWHGDVSDVVSAELAAARAEGVRVTVTPAPYTRTQLVDETTRLAKLNMTPDREGPRMERVGPKFDGTGVHVGVSGLSDSLTNAQLAAEARRLLPALSSTVALDVETSPRTLPADRYQDSAPYWGGALGRIGGGTCTTGFGVTGNAGGNFILTADHCGRGTWLTGRGDLQIGTTVAAHSNNDAQLLQSVSGAHIYIGASIAGGTQGPSPVRGYQRTWTGDQVCTSGAFSGTICQIVVNATEQAVYIDGYGPVFGMAIGHQVNDIGAAGNGDSGGPVVVLNADLSSQARGTITGMPYDFVPCQGVPTGGGRECSDTVIFPDIGFALNAFNAHVNVAP